MNGVVTITALAIAAAYFFGSVKNTVITSTLENLDITLGKIQIALQGLEIKLTLPVTIYNGNALTFTVYGITGKLFYGTTELGDIILADTVTFQAQQTQTATPGLTTTWFALGDDLYGLITSGAFLGTLRFKGKILTSLGDFEIDENIPVA